MLLWPLSRQIIKTGQVRVGLLLVKLKLNKRRFLFFSLGISATFYLNSLQQFPVHLRIRHEARCPREPVFFRSRFNLDLAAHVAVSAAEGFCFADYTKTPQATSA